MFSLVLKSRECVAYSAIKLILYLCGDALFPLDVVGSCVELGGNMGVQIGRASCRERV